MGLLPARRTWTSPPTTKGKLASVGLRDSGGGLVRDAGNHRAAPDRCEETAE